MLRILSQRNRFHSPVSVHLAVMPAHTVSSLLRWVQPIGKLLLNFYVVVECQALGVFTPLVDVRSVINKEVPHNADSIAHSARPVNPFFHNKKMFFFA